MHIDWWTLALQTVNVLILVWILGHFLYRPIADIIEQRRIAAAKGLADASAMRDAVQAEKVQIASTRAGFAQERDALLAEARKQIESERSAMLKDASDRIEKLRSENDAMLSRDRAAIEHDLVEKASGLSVQIAQRLLEKLPPHGALTVFLDAMSEQIRGLPPTSRELLAASAQGGTLALTTASRLTEAEQRQCETAIEAALGMKAKVTFNSDPRLIAGLELRADALVLKNNWRSDLSQILTQLSSDDGQR